MDRGEFGVACSPSSIARQDRRHRCTSLFGGYGAPGRWGGAHKGEEAWRATPWRTTPTPSRTDATPQPSQQSVGFGGRFDDCRWDCALPHCPGRSYRRLSVGYNESDHYYWGARSLAAEVASYGRWRDSPYRQPRCDERSGFRPTPRKASPKASPGANWIRPGRLKCKWRAVVGQQATLKADHKLFAEENLVLAA